MAYNEKKEKSWRSLRIREIILYLCPKSSILSRGMHRVSWWSANRRRHISNPTYQKNPNISDLLIRFQRRLSNMSGPSLNMSRPPLFPPINRAYPTLVPGSSKPCRTCPVPGPDIFGLLFPTVTKSFCRTYLVGSPGSRDVSRTYPIPRPDMSSLLVLTRVKSRCRTCPMSRSGSSNIFRTCSDLWHPIGRFLLGAIKRGLRPPSLRWPLHWLKYTLNQHFLSSNPLSYKLHSNPSFICEIWIILWVTLSIFKQNTSLTIFVCSLLLGTCPVDGLGILREPPRSWWASENLYCLLFHGDLIVKNWTRFWWSFGEV
jgi:hypothetical protein